jgi:hypothetical protein
MDLVVFHCQGPHFETAKVRRSVDAKAGTSFAKVGQRLVDTGVIVPMEI